MLWQMQRELHSVVAALSRSVQSYSILACYFENGLPSDYEICKTLVLALEIC